VNFSRFLMYSQRSFFLRWTRHELASWAVHETIADASFFEPRLLTKTKGGQTPGFSLRDR
jgi:hypothetical protein